MSFTDRPRTSRLSAQFDLHLGSSVTIFKMAIARLNVDVLAIICDFLTDVPHILAFAVTCSTLHSIAIRRLLSMRPIYLGRSPESIRQFHSFVLADKLNRVRHIRSLEIGTRPPPRLSLPEVTPVEDDPLLVDILNWCRHLEQLSVVLRAAPYSYPSISDIIPRIHGLRSLSIHGKLEDPLNFFRGIRVPLRTLSIQCSGPGGYHWTAWSLEKILPRFAATLTKLELTTFYSYPYETGANGISTPSRHVFSLTQYPAVRSFSVAQLQGMPSLEHLQHLFPTLDGTLSLYLLDVWAMEGSFATLRAANKRAQGNDNNREPSSCAWSKLARVACGVHMFYVLGLRCSIGLLMLDRVSIYTKRYLVEALREQPVPRLQLSLVLIPGHDVFDSLFPPELGDTLTHLTLFCEEEHYVSTVSIVKAAAVAQRRLYDIADKMRPSLAPLHGLTHLRLVFHFVNHCPGVSSPSAAGKENHPCAHEEPMFDRADETVAALARALPSLEYTFLAVIGHLKHSVESQRYERWNPAQAWRVARETKDGEPILVELHDEVAETIIRKEELVLSKADEAALLRYGGQH